MLSRTAAVGFVLIALPPATPGQTVRPEFDVASVRESRSGETGGTLRFMLHGSIQAQAIPVRTLITVAFDLQPCQVVGTPDWSREIRYGVQAKPGQPVAREQARAMLQALLIDRFQLIFHRERRELNGFRLVRSSPDRLGPTDDRPSFVTALQEQLGLRLERQRVTDDVFVVERLQRASTN